MENIQTVSDLNNVNLSAFNDFMIGLVDIASDLAVNIFWEVSQKKFPDGTSIEFWMKIL